ncbi:FlaG/FlaF family flagellin (archaellin) [Methanohalophilus levihalophilus]|uniref:type IV pilin n=1 Tax=Methanohalophilus levihalophilus TaxID=1431282 RepID=UPI001AE55E26|nr:type IV pilin N-terminal domain-containing protein [Methanohalophilus levihalophilus]MBP2029184.1 FlaG/FlaF family flagellin (archaellin) [Methanohalophilus levihalophilus]
MKTSNLFEEELALTPVIGTILMILIVVILASVSAIFLFDLGVSDEPPQASIKGTLGSANTGNFNVIMIEHQGGSEVMLNVATTRVEINGEAVNLDALAGANVEFEAGDVLYLVKNGSSTPYWLLQTSNSGGAQENVLGSGDTVGVKFIDINSQAVISDFEVSF